MQNKKQEKNLVVIPQEIIEQKILIIRGKKVMLDRDLAVLYGVKTKELNKAVSRNSDRFPEDFMFQLNKSEIDFLRFQIGTLKRGQHSKYLPHVFTENGVAMLSSVLRSKKAVQVNIQIMRTFTRIRELIISNKELRLKLEELESKTDKKFAVVFKAIANLIGKPEKITTKRIGFNDKRGK